MLKRLLDKVLPSVIASVVVASLGGIINMNLEVTRLRATVEDVKDRVARIERHIDTVASESPDGPRYGMLDNE